MYPRTTTNQIHLRPPPSTRTHASLPTPQFPYYTFVDRGKMYTVGSLFYAIYFFVSFPWFFLMDEDVVTGPRPRRPWTVGQAATDALAASMLVTILLDLWRLGMGPIIDVGAAPVSGAGAGLGATGLPWL